MNPGQPREYEMDELHAALAGVPITEPDAEILATVESALSRFPTPEDWYPGVASAGGA